MLKVDSPQPPIDMMPPEPPMGGGNMGQMGGDMPPMNDNQPPMGDDGMNSEFDTNFDAGVDANEQEDPKKFIQQLTGKLSQSLRKYNNEQPQPDAELSKYVCGMIVKQAIEGLKPEDVEDIMKKIKSDDDFDNDTPEDNQLNNNGGSEDMQPQTDQPEQMPMESLNRNHNQKIEEIFQDLISTEKEDTIERPLKRTNSFRHKPFTSPNFD